MIKQEYFANIEHVDYLLRQIKAAKLNVPVGFNTNSEILQQCYNGIGPDRWSSRLRRFTTALLEQFEPEALIHDWEYTYTAKTFWSFTIANIRFLYNGIKYAVFCYRFSKRTVRQIRLSICLAILCQLFGWNGFKKTKVEK